MEISWSEAVDLLAEEGDSTINHGPVYKDLLRKKGFMQHKALLCNGRKLNGKDFCAEMTRRYHSGERIFAHLGRCHAGAILPVKDSEDRIVYKIHDSWDSTNRLVGEYWVQLVTSNKEVSKSIPAESSNSSKIGDTIEHPTFGKAVVADIDKDIMTVTFEKGQKRLSDAWIAVICGR